jgi:thiol-disulfide isomerase/thioredoxin
MKLRAPFLVAALATVACLACASRPALESGTWRAWLDSPGGELPFGLELTHGDGAWSAHIVNGAERIEVGHVDLDGDRLTLRIEHYDATVEATRTSPTRLDGRWWKTGKLGAISELPFHAAHGETHRFTPLAAAGEDGSVGGRWAVRFGDEEEDPAVAEFEQGDDGEVTGTFMTTTGDYRYLAGSFEGDRLRLSVFDGAHAFLFDARLQPDGSLAGNFWSRESWHDTWTAQRNDTVTLDAATEQVAWVGGIPLAEVAYPDLEGALRSLDDPEFAGRARILEVFGTWCPNCNDATEYLVDLHGRYRERGLSIVGLAFEMTGEFARDAEQIRVYREHHGIEYPILVAGTSDKAEASAAFPLIERIKSYPTTIFMEGNGNVHTIYSGFSGPATGEAYTRLQALFESTIEELLGDE